MTATISDHQARVYEYAKVRAGQWLTTQEISVATNVPENNVKLHAARFEDIGIFERIRISPAHAFRLDAEADAHAHQMVVRLNEALEIFSARRLEWLKREESIVRSLDGRLSKTNAHAESKRSIQPGPMSKPIASGPSTDAAMATAPKVRRGSKFDLLLSMVSRDEGASLDELVAALGNLAHSIRATISVESRKRGLKIECVNRRYYLRSVA